MLRHPFFAGCSGEGFRVLDDSVQPKRKVYPSDRAWWRITLPDQPSAEGIQFERRQKSMIVFLSDPTGLSAEATHFYKTEVIEQLMHAHYRMEAGWTLVAPSFVMYDADPRGEPWHDGLHTLNGAIQEQAFTGIEASDVALIMMEGTELPGAAAAAMGYAHALGKPVLIFRHNRERIVGKAFASVGLLAEYVSRESGGAVVTSVEELLAELARLDADSDVSREGVAA